MYKPRPPSLPHPDDMTEFGKVEDMKAAKSGGYVKRMGGKVGKQIRKKHACERAMMCCLAVSLLWITSLGMSKALVRFFIPTPNTDDVVDAFYGLVNQAKTERQGYETRAKEAADECREKYELDLNGLATVEYDGVNGELILVQQNLDYILSQYQQEMKECQSAYSDAITILNYLQIDHGVGLNGFNVCPGQQLDDLVSDEVVTVQAINEAAEFKRVADAEVQSLSDQINARAAYDAEFLNNITGGVMAEAFAQLNGNLTDPAALMASINNTVNEAMACMNPNGVYGTSSCPENSVFARAKDQYNSALSEYEGLRDNVERYRNEAYAKLGRFQDLYYTVYQGYLQLEDAGIIGQLDFLNGLLVSTPLDEITSLLGAGLADLLGTNPDQIYSEMEARAQDASNQLLGEGNALADANRAFTDTSGFVEDTMFSDYNPPQVDTNSSNAEYNEESDTVVGRLTTDLSAVSNNEDDQADIDNLVQNVQLNASEASSALLQKADPRTWEAYQYEDEVFNRLKFGFENLNNMALILDYTYRILKSIMLIRKYWNLSALNTPPADVRTKEGITNGMFTEKKNILQNIGALLTHPAVNLILIVLFIGFFSSAFYFAYEPVYNEYVQGCNERCMTELPNTIPGFQNTISGNGTMLYRNSFAVAEQYAYADGDYVISTEVEALNVEREITCKDSVISSLDKKLQQDDFYAFLKERQDLVIAKTQFLRQCVNIGDINTLHGSKYAGLNETFRPFLLNNISSVCSTPFVDLDTLAGLNNSIRIFDCNRLSACELDLSGPNELFLRGNSFEASCTMEWYGHAQLLGLVMVTAVFFLMNLSRFIFMRSIVQIYWRHLISADSAFGYLATCTEGGRIIYPEDVTEKGESFRAVIIKQLRVALGKFEREGYALILFSIALNVPWIVILDTLRKTLQFDPNKICD